MSHLKWLDLRRHKQSLALIPKQHQLSTCHLENIFSQVVKLYFFGSAIDLIISILKNTVIRIRDSFSIVASSLSN